jgi:hypothetical protein
MKLAESSMSDEDTMFKSICVGDLKKKLADTAVNHFKPNIVDVHITGPFHHAGKSNWVVVYGENKQAYMLKPTFILVYVSCLLHEWKKVTKSNINVDHCSRYYDIGICKHQFGRESTWERTGAKKSPITKVSFVYSHDSKIEDTAGKKELMGAIRFFFLSMKERVDNPIGPLLVNHLHEKMENLYTYLVNNSNGEDLAAEKITRAISQHFSGGPNIIWNDRLNHWLVDYDIIRVLRYHMGYKSWSEVPVNQRELCYQGYTTKNELPPWDVQKESYLL